MERKDFSKSAKSFVEGAMSSHALSEAKTWLDVLHDAEFRGRKDTDGAARYRLANRLGIKESYLFRLQYRAAEMKDVAGEVYRRLKIAYDGLCERTEAAADAMERERLKITGTEYAVETSPLPTGEGMASAAERAAEQETQ